MKLLHLVNELVGSLRLARPYSEKRCASRDVAAADESLRDIVARGVVSEKRGDLGLLADVGARDGSAFE